MPSACCHWDSQINSITIILLLLVRFSVILAVWTIFSVNHRAVSTAWTQHLIHFVVIPIFSLTMIWTNRNTSHTTWTLPQKSLVMYKIFQWSYLICSYKLVYLVASVFISSNILKEWSLYWFSSIIMYYVSLVLLFMLILS